MAHRKSDRPPVPAALPTAVIPAGRGRAGDLLRKMSALDHAGDHPAVDTLRQRLREEARRVGMRLVSFTITEEPIPDPHLEALPRKDFDRIAAISRDMRRGTQKHVAELERLAVKYPHIPMLRNHLAGALQAAGARDRAAAVVAEAARRFPTYFFAFDNHVMMLLSDGKIDDARALVEGGPRGPVFGLTDFDPSRDTFHLSEAISHAAMVGHYLLATGRREAADVQLGMLKKMAPKSAQYRSLAAVMGRSRTAIDVAAALLRMKADLDLREERRKARAAKKAAGEGMGPRAKGGARPVQVEGRATGEGPGLFQG